MPQAMHESPFNRLPPVVWALAAPAIALEAWFALGGIGLAAGGTGLRGQAIAQAAFAPQIIAGLWSDAPLLAGEAYRLLSYSFVNGSPVQALFVVVFTLALGNMVATRLRPAALVALFFGAAIGGAAVFAAVTALMRTGPQLLIGGYPAVYGLVGGFTFLLWTRLAAENANRFRAFSLIGMLLIFQLVFALVFGGAGLGWIAEIGGFVTGFLLSAVLVQGGLSRALRQLRRR